MHENRERCTRDDKPRMKIRALHQTGINGSVWFVCGLKPQTEQNDNEPFLPV